VTFAQEALPALGLTAICASATLAGKSLALALDLHGVAVAAFATVPAVLVFTWREAGLFRTMAGRAFGSGETTRVELSEEHT